MLETGSILSEDELLSFLDADGPFFQMFPRFETRDEQKSMLQDVIKAFNENKVALIEAGTGTGKSLAYLLPAIFHALKTSERVLISTRTIALQEQLFLKDIPMLKSALGLSVKAVLAKGMGNYVCLRRLKESMEELLLFPGSESQELIQIEAWSKKTEDGTKKDLPLIPSPAVWEKIIAERDACNREKCPHYKECFFYKARKDAQDAKILIANHSLFLSDLSCREKNGTGLLPDYTRVIIDEGHHLEDVALEHMAEVVSFSLLTKLVGRLHADKGNKLLQLAEKLRAIYKKDESPLVSIIQRINLSLPEAKTRLIRESAESFDQLSTWCDSQNKVREEDERKHRLKEHHLRQENWKRGPESAFKICLDALKSYLTELLLLINDIGSLKSEKVDELTEGFCLEITSLIGRLEAIFATIKGFIAESFQKSEVRWIESPFKRGIESLRIYRASLDVAERLEPLLFKSFPTVLLCSATLAADGGFKFLKKRLGINNKAPIEKIYFSPFDYATQALLAVAQDLPSPLESGYFESACSMMLDAIKIQPKGTFILSTSFSFLERAYQELKPTLESLRFTVFKQGHQSKSTLLKEFLKAPRPVLFATDSFWEGVDVQGGILKLVIITRLPFKVPDEPLVQAMAEKILSEGGDPFSQDSLPDAIVKFKQGFGRLIRSKNDRGVVLCLDKRLATKNYGKAFLKSLPPCQYQFLPKEELLKSMKRFYFS